MPALIEAHPPETWQELEIDVARILSECGYETEVQKKVKLARGEVSVDVWAVDETVPPSTLAVECKNWKQPVSKTVVHGFRTVIADSGANAGLLISAAGFQHGAVAASAHSNLTLLDWVKFQEFFRERWFRNHMAPLLQSESAALIEYTEPINSRIQRKENGLSPERLERLASLRDAHFALAMCFIPLYAEIPDRPELFSPPDLPLRSALASVRSLELPPQVLDASALRPLLDALVTAYRAATKEFDDLFGERA